MTGFVRCLQVTRAGSPSVLYNGSVVCLMLSRCSVIWLQLWFSGKGGKWDPREGFDMQMDSGEVGGFCRWPGQYLPMVQVKILSLALC